MLRLGAENIAQEVEHLAGPFICNMVKQGLGLPPEIDQAFLAKPCEMLGQSGLAKADPIDQLPHGQLACRNKVAEDEQPLFVRQGFHQRRRACCSGRHLHW